MEPISALSGGERNRLLLARLFTRPANLLVMDEPTNDLDVETLELLEARLVDYQGTLLLVSHDREFIDNVVTSTLVFEGGGRIGEYVGGYTDWLRQRQPLPTAAPRVQRPPPAAPARPGAEAAMAAAPKKLSYKLQRELDALPARIESLETEQARLHERAADPELYRQEARPACRTRPNRNRAPPRAATSVPPRRCSRARSRPANSFPTRRWPRTSANCWR